MQVDKNKIKRHFDVSDWVYLNLQPYRQVFVPNRPYRQVSIPNRSFHKLATLYYELYKVLKVISTVAYPLELLKGTKIYLIFYISLLKKHHNNQVI